MILWTRRRVRRIYFEFSNAMDNVVLVPSSFCQPFCWPASRGGDTAAVCLVEPVAGHTSCCPSSSPAKAVAA